MNTQQEARLGLKLLEAARDAFKRSRSPRTLARVRLAISSAKGAIRHAGHASYRAERRARK